MRDEEKLKLINLTQEEKELALNNLFKKDLPAFNREYRDFIADLNWEDIFFKSFGPTCLKRLNELKEKFEFFPFLEGLRYEFGYNNTQIDLNKAYQFYKTGADNQTDFLSMYKMYSIHLSDEESKKFNINRDRILEWFYLLKCEAFYEIISDKVIYPFKIEPRRYLIYHTAYEDFSCSKTLKLIALLKKNNKYNIDINILNLIEARILVKYSFWSDFKPLRDIANKNNLEACFQLAKLLTYQNNDKYNEEIMKLYRICEENKYYRSYNSYGIFLFDEMNQVEKAIKIFYEGSINGNFFCYKCYYYSLNSLIDFDLIKTSNEYSNKAISKIQYLLDYLLLWNFDELFELGHLLAKFNKFFPFNIKKEDFYFSYFNEISDFLLKNVNNNILLDDFTKHGIKLNDFFVYVSILYLYDKIPIVQKDLSKSLFYIKKAWNIDKNYINSFVYYYIYEIRKTEFRNGSISEEKYNKVKDKIFDLYDKRILSNDNFLKNFYSIGKFYEKGIGIQQNFYLAYEFYNKTANAELYLFGNTTNILYYKYKSKIKLKENRFIEIKEKIEKDTDYIIDKNELNKLDKICFNCNKNEIELIFLYCKDTICKECYEKLKIKQKCPFCSNIIFHTKNIKHN